MGARRCDLRDHGSDEDVELLAGVLGACVCVCGLANHGSLRGDCGTWALVSYGGCLGSCADCDYGEPGQSYHGAEGGVLIGRFAAGAVTLHLEWSRTTGLKY